MKDEPTNQPARRATSGRTLLIALSITLAIVTLLLFLIGHKGGAPRETAYVFLGGLISALLALAAQLLIDRANEDQTVLLRTIHGNLDKAADDVRRGTEQLKEAVSGVSFQVTSTADIIDQVRRTASAAREDIVRMTLTGPDSVAGKDLRNTSVAGLVLRPGRDLTEANLQEVAWTTIEADQAVFARARLERAVVGGTLNGSVFSGAFLQGCTLAGNFGGCHFDDSILQGTRLQGYFRGSDFWKPKEFMGVQAALADLRDCHFGGIDYLQQSCFWATTLGGSTFLDTCLGGCDFRWSSLTEVRFKLTERMAANTLFAGALLDRTDFRETSVATLRAFNLAGAIDSGALWPDGFDPAAAGVLSIGTPEGLTGLQEHLEVRGSGQDCPDHGERTTQAIE